MNKKEHSYFKVCFTGDLFSTFKKGGGSKHELWLFSYLKVNSFVNYTDKSKVFEDKVYGNKWLFWFILFFLIWDSWYRSVECKS